MQYNPEMPNSRPLVMANHLRNVVHPLVFSKLSETANSLLAWNGEEAQVDNRLTTLQQVRNHIERESEVLFPYLEELERMHEKGASLSLSLLPPVLRQFRNEHSNIRLLLNDWPRAHEALPPTKMCVCSNNCQSWSACAVVGAVKADTKAMDAGCPAWKVAFCTEQKKREKGTKMIQSMKFP